MPNEIATLRAALRTNPEHHAKLRELAEAGHIQPIEGAEVEIETIVAAPEHFGIEGAQQAQCGCGTFVWLSPVHPGDDNRAGCHATAKDYLRVVLPQRTEREF